MKLWTTKYIRIETKTHEFHMVWACWATKLHTVWTQQFILCRKLSISTVLHWIECCLHLPNHWRGHLINSYRNRTPCKFCSSCIVKGQLNFILVSVSECMLDLPQHLSETRSDALGSASAVTMIILQEMFNFVVCVQNFTLDLWHGWTNFKLLVFVFNPGQSRMGSVHSMHY